MSTQIIIAIGWIGTSLITGVLGMVLGPWIRYRIFRSYARSLEQKQMLEAWLDMTRQQSGHFLAAVYQVKEGKRPGEAASNCVGAIYKWMRETPDVTRYPWEPSRVLDKKLRGLFEDLTAVKTRLLMYTVGTAKGQNGSAEKFVERVQREVNETEALRRAILERMARRGL